MEILAVPDNIYSIESKGSNRLIYEGASIYLDTKQLLIENRYMALRNESQDIMSIPNSLNELEKGILKILTSDGPKTLEEISILMDMDIMELLGKLSMMELEGKVNIQGSKVSSTGYGP